MNSSAYENEFKGGNRSSTPSNMVESKGYNLLGSSNNGNKLKLKKDRNVVNGTYE